MKFNGPIGNMIRQHRRYARGGRTKWADQVGLHSDLEAATGAVMAGCRRGVDREEALAQDQVLQLNLLRRVAWIENAPTQALPLYELTRLVSEAFRAQLPMGDNLRRRAKKEFKKELKAQLDQFADTLTRGEQKYGHRQLGVRTK